MESIDIENADYFALRELAHAHMQTLRANLEHWAVSV